MHPPLDQRGCGEALRTLFTLPPLYLPNRYPTHAGPGHPSTTIAPPFRHDSPLHGLQPFRFFEWHLYPPLYHMQAPSHPTCANQPLDAGEVMISDEHDLTSCTFFIIFRFVVIT